MGEVYRARDTKLERDVAIKVLPAAVMADSARLARFRREALSLASLNHPHIGAIYGVEESSGFPALVLELVEGDTLAERLRKGPLPIADALNVARQIAEALDAAHERGIIHRDLKPANIKITPDARIKVLDFGLAAVAPGEAAASDSSPTVTRPTRDGTIVGTAAYMSPEQARGQSVDKRSDIWAFGCVLYEMLTGRMAFKRETFSDTIAAIIERDPDWNALPVSIPPQVSRLLKRCLEKDPKRRLRDIGDSSVELDLVVPTLDATPLGSGRWFTRERRVWTVAGVGSAAVVTAAVLFSGPRSPAPAQSDRPVRKETISLASPERLAFGTAAGEAGHTVIAFSPDGNHLVYVAGNGRTTQLHLRSMQEFVGKPIAGTEGAFSPFFSPDGQWIAFFTPGKLRKVFLRGGEPVIVSDATRVWGATWTSNGTIFFSPNEGSNLARVSAEGGIPEIIAVARREFLWPAALPGKDELLVTSYAGRRPQIELFAPATRKKRVLIAAGSDARYIPTGHLIYTYEGALYRVPFDSGRLEVTGPPTPVLAGVRTELHGAGQFAIAADGALAYVEGPSASKGTLVWVDRKGAVEQLPVQAQQYGHLGVSPDGLRIAVEITSTNTDVFIFDLTRGNWSKLTTEGNNIDPVWTPDGKRVVFASDRNGPLNLFWQFADGDGAAEQLITSKNEQFPYSWSPDGKVLAMIEFASGTRYDVGLLPMQGTREVQPILRTRFSEAHPAFSPDGRWIAFSSDESGRFEIYVQRHPATNERWKISTDGGVKPIWSPSGDELLYEKGLTRMAVKIVRQPAFAAGNPQVFAEGPYIAVPGRSFDVDRTGRRLLLIRELDQPSAATIRVVSNWFQWR